MVQTSCTVFCVIPYKAFLKIDGIRNFHCIRFPINILGSIWEYYVNHIDELPVVYQSIADDEGPQRAVCDYVSGMTDSYALEVYSELFIPAAWTIK